MSTEKEISELVYPENIPDSAIAYIESLQESVKQLMNVLNCINDNGLQVVHFSVVTISGEVIIRPVDMAAKSIIGGIGKRVIVAAITNEIARINKIKRSVVSQYENPDYS